MSQTLTTSVSPSLLALKPRQVLLSQTNMTRKARAETPKSDQGVSLEPEQRTLLLHAVAFYLERNGFSKSLKKFRSEAQIEVGTRYLKALFSYMSVKRKFSFTHLGGRVQFSKRELFGRGG